MYICVVDNRVFVAQRMNINTVNQNVSKVKDLVSSTGQFKILYLN